MKIQINKHYEFDNSVGRAWNRVQVMVRQHFVMPKKYLTVAIWCNVRIPCIQSLNKMFMCWTMLRTITTQSKTGQSVYTWQNAAVISVWLQRRCCGADGSWDYRYSNWWYGENPGVGIHSPCCRNSICRGKIPYITLFCNHLDI